MDAELDKLLAVYGVDPKYPNDAKKEAKQAILDWHNKQTEQWFQVLIDEVGYEKAVAYKEAMKHG